jgi:alkanesulfonate monooxygenase SsuD/methylene tetrahydromethanopterin reductase-like flavin-dependent oxidoreductase (luciferase family)
MTNPSHGAARAPTDQAPISAAPKSDPRQGLRLGILLWSQATDWPGMAEAAQRVDRLGYDSLWTWDHLYAIFGDPLQANFEGYTALAGMAGVTERVRLGLMVGANTFRNPGVVVKAITTIDHISRGRAVLGLGGAWFEDEHTAFGIDFGSGFGERLDRMEEALGIMRDLLDGRAVTHDGPTYQTRGAISAPLPLQPHLPILIGGSGERKTLRSVALHADMWNAMGPVDLIRHKVDVLGEHCVAVGRDPSTIEFTLNCKLTIRDTRKAAERALRERLAHNRTPAEEVLGEEGICWLGAPGEIAETILRYRELGFRTVVSEMPAPYDAETIERFIGEVKPLVDAA